MTAKPIVTRENVDQVIRELLDFPFCLRNLEAMTPYRVQTDDTDGSPTYGWLSVVISPDSDVHLRTTSQDGLPDEIRFRTYFGGGKHLRARNAVLILAEAIRLENEGE